MEKMDELFEDPINYELMVDPVVSSVCGHSFSQSTISEWLSSHSTCPICSSSLTLSDLTPNWTLRQAIQAFHSTSTTSSTPEQTSASQSSLSTVSPPDSVFVPTKPPPSSASPPETSQSVAIQDSSSAPSPSSFSAPLSHVYPNMKVVRLTEKDCQRAGRLLARTFFDSRDPWFHHIFVNDSNFEAAVWFMELVIFYGAQQGYVYSVQMDETLVGVSVWQAPIQGMGVSFWNLLKSGLLAGPWKLGPFIMARLLAILYLSEAWHLSAIQGQRHWSLYSIGLDSHFQNQGIGSELMKRILRRVDEDGCIVYTDTSNPRNLSFFSRLGFEIREVAQPSTGPTFWMCIRPVQAQSQSQ